MGIYLDEPEPDHPVDQSTARERSGYYLPREGGRLIVAPPAPTWPELIIGSMIGAGWMVYAVGGYLRWW